MPGLRCSAAGLFFWRPGNGFLAVFLYNAVVVAFLNALVDLASHLSPVVTIAPDEMGVFVRCGKIRRTLPPGIYLKCPIIDTVEAQSVVDTIAELNTQTLTTSDGVCISVSGRIRYRIADIAKAHYEVYDLGDAIVEECEAHVADAIMDRDWQQALERYEVEQEVLESVQERAIKWGVDAREFSITNLAKCRTIRLLQE